METTEIRHRKLSNLLWGQAKFITSKERNGRRVSLYLFNKEYYAIWYTRNDFEVVENIEPVAFSRANEIFGNIY